MLVGFYGDSQMSMSKDYLHWFAGMKGWQWEDHFWPGTAPCDWLGDASTWNNCDLVIASFMGNMLTPCTQGRGTPQQVFTQDINTLADIWAYLGKNVLWIGPPGITNTHVNSNWRLPILKAASQKYPFNQRYYDAGEKLRQSNGIYTSWLGCDQRDHDQGWCWEPYGIVGIRDADGTHMTPAGQCRWAEAMLYVA